MTRQNRVNISQLLSDISNGIILIPDFQRGFVWNKIESQQKLIASVFSRLPIGSILLLEGSSTEFRCKQIGSKLDYNIDDNDNNLRKFLIDGQQRVTVLANTFSDKITSLPQNVIVSQKLRHRYYLRIAVQSFNNIDLFGLTNLKFPFSDANNAFFIGDRVNSLIEREDADNNSIFPPRYDITRAMNDVLFVNRCVSDDETECKIPLCIIADQQSLIISKILDKVAKQREEVLLSMADQFFNTSMTNQYMEFLDSLTGAENSHLIFELKNDFSSARATLQNMASTWKRQIKDYFDICIKGIEFYEINVTSSERARAIDIYENLNIGGVSLTTFDLLVAKVARKDSNNFQKQIEEQLLSQLQVPTNHHLYNFLEKFNFSQFIEKFDLIKSDTLSKSFLDVFMNLLTLISMEKLNPGHEFTVNDIKRETILALDSQQILDNYSNAILGIKRALIFMMYDLGIKKLSDIQYEHVLLNISKILSNDTYWLNSNSFSNLKYWYWTVVFSGSYDRDQSQQMILDMNFLKRLFNQDTNLRDNYLSYKRTLIFDQHYFTKKSILLMGETDNDAFPKNVIKSLLLQFILSRKPNDFLINNDGTTVGLKSYSDDNLQAHHIIPLNTATSLNDSTKGLRKNKEHILNSPINFTYITSTANNRISSNSLTEYYSRLTPIVFTGHILPNWPPNAYTELQSSNSHVFESAVKRWLDSRYNQIKGEIDNELNRIVNSMP